MRLEHSIRLTATQLESLLGPQRAAVLRCLDDAATCGAIAESLFMAPGGVTHHLRVLEAAGLVTRTRRGRHVVVERTAKGCAIIALYQAPQFSRSP
jgi:DNA-binding MarR family transcriptional regulator